MRKLFFGLACVAGVGVLFIGQKTPERASDLTLENIEAVGLSAVEAECDPVTTSDCSITIGIVEGKGKGKLIVKE